MKKVFTPRRLDPKAFAQEQALLEGQDPVAGFARLLAETQDGGGARAVTWSAQGELGNPHHLQPDVWLHLRAQALLPLACQRCLRAVDLPVEVERSFRFVADESMAAAQDDESEEDVLALSPSFDLLELLEDELLMALPLAPRHETCPGPVAMQAVDADFEAESARRDNPFALLGQLKTPKA
ncbi:MAG TPA: YceD family protein [Ramlibacter sp.]|nr:YceD family protein [Ramlibacter sp.]